MDIIKLVDNLRGWAELAAFHKGTAAFPRILEWVEYDLATLAKVEYLTEA